MRPLHAFLPLTAVLLTGWATTQAAECRLLSITRFDAFERLPGSRPDEQVLLSPPISPGFPWRELVVSWNAATNLALTVEVRPLPPDDSRFYSFGRWTAAPGPESPRQSEAHQKDDRGTLSTDTLTLRTPSERAQVRITLSGPDSALKRLSLAFTGNHPFTTAPDSAPAPAPRDLDVPLRSQAEFPEGIDKWCSPTSTSMLLAYWSAQRNRGDWNHSVPETAAAVYDSVYRGTGNWSFNMAFAGSHPGLQAAVARFPGLRELETWVASGAPAAASVSNSLLKGKPEPTPGDGHLIVVRGFTADGDVIINDPGVRIDRVRRVVPRATFLKAWGHSDQTVYLIWPDDHPLPSGPAFPQ
jgi:hypothetical protein